MSGKSGSARPRFRASSGSLPDRRSARSRRGDSGRLSPSTPWTRCVLQPFFSPVHGRAGSGLLHKATSGSSCSVFVDPIWSRPISRAVAAMQADVHPPALGSTWPSSSRSRRRTAVVVFPDVSGRCAAVCDAKLDAEAPFGSNPGPAASADEKMRPRTRATPSCRRSQPQGIIS